ncbi:MAG: hypothetical protein E7523_03670 [Ruminococcaceae bacterium]|nr:hypothetical protein [Oscillospiraceae bacterium]
MTILYIILGILGAVVFLTVIEIAYLFAQTPAQELPEDQEKDLYSTSVNGKSFEDLYLFLAGEETKNIFTDEEIYELLERQSRYMGRRFDCADFRAQMLFKIYKDCGNVLNEKCKELIKNTFLNFKYFMDEPGDDSMCYWSENHQILFAVSEYLAGQEWPDAVFSNNKMTGKEHMAKAKVRIAAWMEQRFNFGFAEYLSNNYLAEDIAPMANFIAYAKDEKSVEQMKIIMDILWFDVALNSVNNRFVAVSSRMYGNNKAGNFYGNSIQSAMNILWGADGVAEVLKDPYLSAREKNEIAASLAKTPNHIVLCFTDIVKKGLYVLPDAIKDVALSKETFVSKMGCGLSTMDMQEEGFVGCEPHQIMAQLGAETFTNHQVIDNTLKYLKENKMYRNSFLGYFKFLNLTVFRAINWKKFAEKHNIVPHGIATGRGNVYTYRTARYSLSTDICKDVDMCGAQDHEWTANIGETLALFTTHPAGNGNGRYGSSPGYWIGNGRRPMSVQHKNVNITIYKLPDKKRLGETAIADMTHAYMPKDFYDEFELLEDRVFARKNGVFVSLTANGRLQYKPFDTASAKGVHKSRIFPDSCTLKSEFDLCRYGGTYHAYITELSDADKETFEQFKERISNNTAEFTGNKVYYNTLSGDISVSYNGEFIVNNSPSDKVFDRYDSKFCKAKRKSPSLLIDSGENKLLLDYKNAKRETVGNKAI